MSRSRSNMLDTIRQATTSTAASTTAMMTAVVAVGLKTWSDISNGSTRAGRLARVPSCWATRTSDDRAEIAVPTHTDHMANSGANSSSAKNHDGCHTSWATMLDAPSRMATTKMMKKRYATPDGRDGGRQRLTEEELLSRDRRREQWFEGALVTLSDHRVGRDRRGQHHRNDQ